MQHIESCIKSVLSQTYENIEYIVIDGNSTDGTKEIIEKYIDRIDFYLSEDDNGIYNALNKGVKCASGDVVGILHSDDEFYDVDTVQSITNCFVKNNVDLIYANGLYVNKKHPEKITRIYDSKPFKKRFLNYGWIPLHTTIYVKKGVFDKYGNYDEGYSIASDYDISLRWFKNELISKHFLDRFVVRMKLGGKSTTSSLQKKKSAEDLEIIRKHQLLGYFTLLCKIVRKIPQYIKGVIFSWWFEFK